jgi:hypothetical protein
VDLGVLVTVLYGMQELGIRPGKTSELFGVYLVGLAAFTVD